MCDIFTDLLLKNSGNFSLIVLHEIEIWGIQYMEEQNDYLAQKKRM
jgi:hypothetical protein